MDYRRAITIFNFQFSIFNKLSSYILKPLDSHAKAGFTLIELLVSIGIIIIIAAATVPGLGSKKTVNELNDIALDFQSKLKQAQSYALSPPTDNHGATAYGVEMTDDNTQISYAIVRMFSDGNKEDYPSNSSLSSNSTKINSVTPPVSIIWYKIGTTIKIETTPASSGNVAFIFGLRNGDTSEIRTVSVDSITGTINAE